VAVVGLGRISASHLQAVQSQPQWGRLTAVVDDNPAKAAEVAARFGAPHALSSLDEALALDEVEAVILCTPNALHARQAEAALLAGRHVLLEKPFCEDVADAERIADLAERKGLTLAAAHTFRHVEAVRHLQDHRHDFGRLRAINVSMCVRWDGPQTPWWATRTPQESLILAQFAPHALDFVQLVMGDEDPIRISVEAARHQTGWLAEDEAMILMRYPRNVMAFIHVSYNQPYLINRKIVHFEKATLRIEDGEYLWIDDTLVLEPQIDEAQGFHRMGGGHYFRTQFGEFVRAVRGLDNRSVLHADALRITKLTRAVIDQALAPLDAAEPYPAL
jgi:predicted dehydrogenase